MDCKVASSSSAIPLVHARFEMPSKMELRWSSWQKIKKDRGRKLNRREDTNVYIHKFACITEHEVNKQQVL